MGRAKVCPVERYVKLGVKYNLAELDVNGDNIRIKFGDNLAVRSEQRIDVAEGSRRESEILAFIKEEARLDELQMEDPLKYEELVLQGKLGKTDG